VRRPVTALHLDTSCQWRGGQRQILWLAQGLLRGGHRPVVAIPPRAPLAREARASGIEIVEIDPTFPEWGPLTVLRLRRAIRQLQVDVLHAHSGHGVALAALAAVGTAASIVCTRHVTFPLRNNLGARLKYRRVDRFIAVSEAVSLSLRDSGIAADRIDVVPPGMPKACTIEPLGADKLGRLGVSPGAPLVVMVTTLDDYKDPFTFLRAVAIVRSRVPSMRAILVGDGPLREQVDRAIDALELQGTLFATGFRDDAQGIIAAADVVCLTSRQEGMPVVIGEAMAAGRPVVVTAAGGTGELVEDGIQGFVVPVGDAAEVARAVSAVLTDKALATRLGHAGLERIGHFSVDRLVSGTLRSYERVLRGEN
jgi:glycosyltransferase involved in cell wall biosynthesis